MRSAINITPRTQAFQAGGQVGFEQGLGDWGASPVQPPPGAAGVTPQPIPPTAQLPDQGDQPQQAIDLSPAAIAQPRGTMIDPDLDVSEADKAENQGWSNLVSVRGAQAPLVKKPEQVTAENHPNYAKAIALRDMLPQVLAEDKTKGQKQYAFVKSQYEAMVRQIKADTKLKNDRANREWENQLKGEQRDIDAKYDPHKADQNLEDFADEMGKMGQWYDRGKDAPLKDRRQLERERAGSMLNTKVLNPETAGVYAREIMALNHGRLTARDAARVMMQLTSPPPENEKPFNSMRERAAAHYTAHGSDSVGNYVIKMPNYGYIRISPETFKELKAARYRAYDQRRKYDANLETRRAEDREPGFFGRLFK